MNRVRASKNRDRASENRDRASEYRARASENRVGFDSARVTAPTGVSVKQVDGQNTATLTWTQVQGADKYDVHNLTTDEHFVRRATGGHCSAS